MDKKLFSKRLRDLRKDCGYKTQYALAKAYNERFGAKRKDEAGGNEKEFGGIFGTIKNYENDSHEGSPKLEIVCNLCEMLGCDVSYLVGDYDELDYPTHKICEATGLSDKAVNILARENERAKRDRAAGWVNLPYQQEIEAASKLIENRTVLFYVYQYIYGNYDAIEIHGQTDDDSTFSRDVHLVSKSDPRGGTIVRVEDMQSVFLLNIQNALNSMRQDIQREVKNG